MATRPRSIYERSTLSTLPPPERRERSHIVHQEESLIVVANKEYRLEEYRADLWRLVGTAAGVLDPFTFESDYRGQRIRIPAPPLPDFV